MRLALAASAGLAALSIGRAGSMRTLDFVPTNGLTLLDPSFADAPFARAHGCCQSRLNDGQLGKGGM